MPVILIVMVSKHYENNFQPVSVEKWGRFYRKKDDWKFSVFRKTCFYGIKLIPAESPTLGESKYIHFIPLPWPDQGAGSKIFQWLTIIPSLWDTVNFCVTFRPFFYLIIFYYFYLSLSTSICLYLLQWLLYPNYTFSTPHYTFPTPTYTLLTLWWLVTSSGTIDHYIWS